MFIIKKQDKKTGERFTIKTIYNTEIEAIEVIKRVLTEYEYSKTIAMRNLGEITNNTFYSRYYYYSIIEII